MARVFWGAHGAVNQMADARVLFVGDSWFWYPLGNLPLAIGSSFPDLDFVVAGLNGSEAAEWGTRYRKEIDYTFRMYASGAQALMLSGGGNDIAGMADFLKIVADDCSAATTVDACYRAAQPGETIDRIMSGYRGVILKFRARNPVGTVFTHNYDHAWPTGHGLFGPADWLKEPMDRARVPAELRRPLLKDLLARLLGAQRQLALDPALTPVFNIASAGTLPEEAPNGGSWWANELHPTPAGFKRLASRVFVPALRQVLG
jgi:hypothetical protein